MTGHERGGRSYLTIGVLLPPNLERVRIESHFMTKLSGAKKRLIIAYAVLGTCVFSLKGESSEIETLINQDKQITEANNDLDGIYQKFSLFSEVVSTPETSTPNSLEMLWLRPNARGFNGAMRKHCSAHMAVGR
jgi:hypothetical protein